MPWKECNRMDERLRLVAKLLDGEKMAVVCRSFGISRKTGYKIFNRYKDIGLLGLEDRGRTPYRYANKLPFQVEKTILRIKQDYPTWGAPKIREKLIKVFPMISLPAQSTIHAVLDRNGLVKRRKRRRYKAKGTTLSDAQNPNELWCADYKGEFRLGNKLYCYPLTITDYRSRYLLACEALDSTKEPPAFSLFERIFKEFGLPAAIRTDWMELFAGITLTASNDATSPALRNADSDGLPEEGMPWIAYFSILSLLCFVLRLCTTTAAFIED
jgi:hypothetical protein